MDRTYRFRISIVIGIILMVVLVYVVRLFSLQMVITEENAFGSSSTTTYIEYVSGSRGKILDTHGNVLVENRATYSVTLQNYVLFNADDPNGHLLRLAQACIANDIEYVDSLPLSYTTPYTYTTEEQSVSKSYYYRWFLLGRQWDADMSAENLYKRLRDAYNIGEEYTDEEARLIMGLRYELDLPVYANAPLFTVVEDISADQLAILKELSIPGMDVVTSSIRVYNTDYAAQLLGHVGQMTAEEYEEVYEAKGYDLNAVVGKEGLEYAFEEYLHGTVGRKAVTVTSDGTVVDEYWLEEPKSGSNVIVTIDIGLQQAAEESLGKYINALAEKSSAENNDGETKGGWDAKSGACVVMKVDTGEVLAAANYPTYKPSEFQTRYNELLETEGDPLANRALHYAYAPGSTFKMITALTAMRTGISPGTTVEAKGFYDVYDDYKPTCWYYTTSNYRSTHGNVNMSDALMKSCNIYFYTVIDVITEVHEDGIYALIDTAESFGLGNRTGSEVPEFVGQVASPELKEELFKDVSEYWEWYAADSLMAAIGQSDTTVTPLQLCRYTAALANKGTLYNATFLRRAVSSDFQSLVKEQTPIAERSGLMSEAEWTVINDGMYRCANEDGGTAYEYFMYSPYEVCAKTGTAQHGLGGSDNAAFVCWYPAKNPEIAISVYVEHGSSGGYWSQVAQEIIEYYEASQNLVQEINLENTPLPGDN